LKRAQRRPVGDDAGAGSKGVPIAEREKSAIDAKKDSENR
jgi:hypothetical protein